VNNDSRYYYAIVACDSAATASHIYSELDGTELERSANVLDLSYVPDDMTFDDDFRSVFSSPCARCLFILGVNSDEATGDHGAVYKPLDFVTTVSLFPIYVRNA
jgi:hypothetical protein